MRRTSTAAWPWGTLYATAEISRGKEHTEAFERQLALYGPEKCGALIALDGFFRREWWVVCE